MPPFGFWPLAVLGFVGLDRLLDDQGRRRRFRRGWLVAMSLYVPGLLWMQSLTLPGYLVACALYATMLAGALALVPSGPARWPATVGAWTLAELLRWSWPFGGVPLANLAIGQVAGPLAPVARVGGALLLVAVTVLAGQALTAAVRRAWRPAGVHGRPSCSSLVVLAATAPRGHDVGHADGGPRAGRRGAGHPQGGHRASSSRSSATSTPPRSCARRSTSWCGPRT